MAKKPKKAKKAKKAKKVKKAKKKGAAKKSATETAKFTRITFGCRGGSCTATPKRAHIFDHGSHVELLATTTNVTVAFDGGKSPFDPNVPIINLVKGLSQTFEVSQAAWGDFSNQIFCLDPNPCPSDEDNPDMIVP